jgi:hypothetical protein
MDAEGATVALVKPLVATLAEATPLINATTPTAIAANKPYFIAVSLSQCCQRPETSQFNHVRKGSTAAKPLYSAASEGDDFPVRDASASSALSVSRFGIATVE